MWPRLRMMVTYGFWADSGGLPSPVRVAGVVVVGAGILVAGVVAVLVPVLVSPLAWKPQSVLGEAELFDRGLPFGERP